MLTIWRVSSLIRALLLGSACPHTLENFMTHHIYKTVELTGSSPQGVQHAIETAVARAGETIRSIRWFEVTQVRGQVDDGKIAHWQVTMKLGFTLEGQT